VPQLVHIGERPGERVRIPAAPVSPQDIDKRFRDMVPPPTDVVPDLRP
jgi:hypothetical protein